MKLRGIVKRARWFFARWLAMEHPGEDLYRIKQFFQLNFLDAIPKSFTKQKRFCWNVTSTDYSLTTISSRIPKDVCIKKFRLYDMEISDVLALSEWRKDFKNGITSRIKRAAKINAQNFEEAGDIRYVSTISRLHHLPVLMLVAHTQAAGINSIIFRQLSEWKNQNPFVRSINWKSGIEVGIRSANLVYLRKALILSKEATKKTEGLIDLLIEEHFTFLTAHLSLYSSANNHLLFELMGIFLISTNYEFRQSDYWRDRSFKWLLAELMKQTYTDGFSKEQSSHYHAEVMNIYSLVFSEAKKASVEIPFFALRRFEKMGEALCYLLNKDVHLIPVGDSDDGQILYPYFDQTFSLYKSLLFDVAALTDRSFYTQPKDTDWDLRNYLLWGECVHHLKERATALPVSPKQRSGIKYFKSSGHLFFVHNKARLLFDMGEIGYGKLAAHGHADILQFLLWVNDEPFIIDPGTYQYHSRFERWRNYFQGTLAHNTISINGLDQAKSGGRMIWKTKPAVFTTDDATTSSSACYSAFHNGFVTQGTDVLHTRSICYSTAEKQFLVTDTLKSILEYEFIFSLHFAPSLHIKHDGNEVLLTGKKGTVLLKSKIFSDAVLTTGNDQQLGGWYSPSYNVLEPTTSLRVTQKRKGTTVIETEVIPHANTVEH